MDRINREIDDLHHQRETTYLTLNPDQISSDLQYVGEAIKSDINFEPILEVGDISRIIDVAANLAACIRKHHPDEYPPKV